MIDPINTIQLILQVKDLVTTTVEAYKELSGMLNDLNGDLALLMDICNKRDKRHEATVQTSIKQFCEQTEQVCKTILAQRRGNFAQKAAQLLFSKSISQRVLGLHQRMKDFIQLYNTDQFGKIEEGTWQLHDDFELLSKKMEELMKDKHLDKITNESAREFWAAHCTSPCTRVDVFKDALYYELKHLKNAPDDLDKFFKVVADHIIRDIDRDGNKEISVFEYCTFTENMDIITAFLRLLDQYRRNPPASMLRSNSASEIPSHLQQQHGVPQFAQAAQNLGISSPAVVSASPVQLRAYPQNNNPNANTPDRSLESIRREQSYQAQLQKMQEDLARLQAQQQQPLRSSNGTTPTSGYDATALQSQSSRSLESINREREYQDQLNRLNSELHRARMNSAGSASPSPPIPGSPGSPLIASNSGTAISADLVDVCFVVDCTGSMAPYLAAARDKVTSISEHVRRTYGGVQQRVAFVGYRDFNHPQHDRFNICQFNFDVGAVRDFIGTVEAHGARGADQPEDMCGGLNEALKLQWRGSTRVIVLIADAPCHGNQYHDFPDHYPKGDPHGLTPELLLGAMIKMGIDLYFTRINSSTDKMIRIWKEIYDIKGAPQGRNLVALQLGSEVAQFTPVIGDSILMSISSSVRRRPSGAYPAPPVGAGAYPPPGAYPAPSGAYPPPGAYPPMYPKQM